MMKRVVRVQSSEILKISGDTSSSSAETNFRELDDVFLQTQTKIWLGEVLHIRFDDETNIADLLADGELLFQVSKVVWKLLLKQNVELKHSKVHIYERTSSGKIDGRYMPYPKVDSFLKICQIIELKGIDLFTPSDVVDKRDVRRVCMCIRTFSKKARSKHLNVPDFDICTYTIAMPTDLVGGIRRYLEQRQNKYVSSNGCNSPSSETKELHQQKSLGRLSILHCDSYSESDGAESILIDSELQSPLSGASYDDAQLSFINGAESPREDVFYNADQYELQSHFRPDNYDKIQSVNEEESDDFSSLKLDMPHEIDEEYDEQFWLTMGAKCLENDLPISSYTDIGIVPDEDTKFVNKLKTSSNSQEIEHRLFDDDVKTNCMEYPNEDSILDCEDLRQGKKFIEANNDDLFKNNKTNSSFDIFKMDSCNHVIDKFIEEYCDNHQYTNEISANAANLTFRFSKSDQKEVENMLTPVVVIEDEIKVAENHSLSSSLQKENDYSNNSQVMYHEKENHCESAMEMHVNNHITKSGNDNINLCEDNDQCVYEKYNFSVATEDSELYDKEILGKNVFSENHPLKFYEYSALNSNPNSLENDKISRSQLDSTPIPFETSIIMKNWSKSEPNVCVIDGRYNLPKQIQSETDKDSVQANSLMMPLIYEVNTSNDLSTKECRVTASETMNIIEGDIVENGLQKIDGLLENPEENYSEKLAVEAVIEDGSETRGKEAEICKKKSKQNKVMKSIAGAVTLLGAIFFVHHVRQKKEKEKSTKSILLLGEQGAAKKVAEIVKKTNEISVQKIYPGERLKF